MMIDQSFLLVYRITPYVCLDSYRNRKMVHASDSLVKDSMFMKRLSLF